MLHENGMSPSQSVGLFWVARLFLTGICFEKIFKTQWVFKTSLAITCSKYRDKFRLTCQLAKKLFETSSVRTPWLTNLNLSFRKRTMRSKAPAWSPKEFSGCLKIPWGFRAQQSWTHLARILELRYSNITWTWKRSLILKTHCVLKIFSNPRRVKNSPATGVRFSTRPQDRVQNGEIPRYKRWANLLCQILVPFLGQLRKAMQADDCEDASQPSSPTAASVSHSCSWIFRFFRLSRPPIGWRGYMPAHQHCDLFYPLVGDLIESTIN